MKKYYTIHLRSKNFKYKEHVKYFIYYQKKFEQLNDEADFKAEILSPRE